MKFTHAHILFWLWALVPAGAVMVYGIRRRQRILNRFVKPDLQAVMIPGFSPGRARAALVLLGLGLSIFALAGPQAGFKWEKTRQRGVDIMIALDCSRSMMATDVSPSRLERAKREIIDLTRLMHSDRAGLVAFSGQAVLQCPLTMDYEVFQIFLDVLGPDYLPVGGTDLAAALSACYRGFDKAADTEKAIIIITDGENTAEGGADALNTVVETLAKEKIRIFAIGVGDPSGAPVPDERGGFKRDETGAIVMSRVDEAGLTRLAGATGGRYVRSVAGDMDLEQIYGRDILNTMERSTFVQGKKKVWVNRFQWALLPAVLLFLAELFLTTGTARKKHRVRKGTVGLLVVVLCLWGTVGPARADLFSSPVKEGMAAYEKGDFQRAKKLFIDAQLDNPDDPRLYYNIGAAAYGAGDYALAKDNFSQALASPDPELRQKALYNLANTRYRMGDLKGAVEDYEKVLKAFPEDTQARENLDYVKKKLEEQQKNQDRKDQQKDQQDQNNQNQNQQDKDQQGQKDQDQNNQDQNNQDQNNQDQSSDGQNQNKKPQGGQPGDKKKSPSSDELNPKTGNNKPVPGQDAGEQTPGSGQNQSVGQSSGQNQQTSGQAPLSGEAARLLESKLNRLDDTPGRALIPGGRAGKIERDW